MKDKYGDEVRLTHMRNAINNIFNFFENLQEEDFKSVRLVCSATIYEFIVIGEASKIRFRLDQRKISKCSLEFCLFNQKQISS